MGRRAAAGRETGHPPTRPPTRSPPDVVPLSRVQSRRFVLLFVAFMLGLAVLATVLITRGWGNQKLQDQVSDLENERRSQMPRLDE